MSDFKEHVIGGIVAYLAFFLVILIAIFLPESALVWKPDSSSSIWLPRSGWGIASCFLIALLSALWPDVDIQSHSRKIFYRIFLILDVYLILVKEYQIAAFLGLFAILPMIGKHRGWTHSKITMLLLPSPFLTFPMLARGEVTWVGLPFYAASVLGYASHLALDKKL